MVKHCLTGLHNNTALLPLVWCCLMSFRDQSFNLEHNMTRRGLTWVHALFRRIKNHWAKCSTLYLSANRVLERVGGGFQGKKNLSRGLGGKKKLQVIWCYFEKQTREQMFHHVRHGDLWVATQAGRCDKLMSWVSQPSGRVMKLQLGEEQRQVCMCVSVAVCMCDSVCVLVSEIKFFRGWGRAEQLSPLVITSQQKQEWLQGGGEVILRRPFGLFNLVHQVWTTLQSL